MTRQLEVRAAEPMTSADRVELSSPLPAPTRDCLLLRTCDGAWTSYELPRFGSMTIGWSEEANVRLLDPAVAPIHLRIEHLGQHEYQVTDLGSTNGTFVGTRLICARTVPLIPGEPVLLGHSLVVVYSKGS